MEGQAADEAEALLTTEAIISLAILLAIVVIFSAFLGQSKRQSAPPFRAFRVAVGIAIGVQWIFVYHASTVLPVRALYPVTERYGHVRVVVRKDCTASSKGGKEAGSWRDCTRGEGPTCTTGRPCTPCDASMNRTSSCTPPHHSDTNCRCSACSAPVVGSSTDCHFHAERGPYCTSASALLDLNGDAVAVPCQRCCTVV